MSTSSPDAVPVTPVAIVGAHGRMGRFAAALLAESEPFRVACEIGRDDDLAELLSSSGVTLALDLTTAGSGAANARTMLECGVRPVVGTSGVTPAEIEALDQLARECGLGGLVVPNFSIGVFVQRKLSELAARHFPHAEIVESHHADKVDAPSGTALDTARALTAVTGETHSIHSLRLPGLFSNQEVVFGGTGEVLRIAHETYGLEAFAPGILGALERARIVTGIEVGLGGVLDLA